MNQKNTAALYEAAIHYIYDIPKFTKKGGIVQTAALMAMIGNPQEDFKYIHVAGTNGKGSVCAFIERGLRSLGVKTGLFTSPHLIKINERIQINGEMISDEDFLWLFDTVKEKVDAYVLNGGVHPTFFEWMYMMAMLWFKRQNVSWAVVETGLGGRLDATNVICEPEITVITSIGFDHMQYLGSDLKSIAGEKAGIIKRGAPLVYDTSCKEAAAVISERFKAVNKKSVSSCKDCVPVSRKMAKNCCILNDGIEYDTMLDGIDLRMHLSMLGNYQLDNSLIALHTLGILGKKNQYFGLKKDVFYRCITGAFKNTVWAGRMEKINAHLYIDGAHNEAGIKALAETMKVRFACEKVYLLFAVAEDKDYDQMIRTLCDVKNINGVMVTAIDSERKTDTKKVADLFEKYGHAPVKQTYNIKEALQAAVQWTGSDILCCCGSLYLAGSIKEILL